MDASGETDLKLARVFISMENWPEAAGPLQQSLEKLPEDKRGQAWLYLKPVETHLKLRAGQGDIFTRLGGG